MSECNCAANTERERHPLDYIFKPRSVAVIGATEKENSVGRTVLWNLLSNPFNGTVYPINPKRPQVLGVHAYQSVKDVPEQVDLAVVCTPAKAAPGILKECIEAGVKGLVILSAGFKEIGPEGAALEQQLIDMIKGTGVRIIGPNCLGIMNPVIRLNASFGGVMPRAGKVALISQSGALGTAILDWAVSADCGFSSFVSIGSMADVNWGDLISYYAEDENTESIVVYMESVGDARAFMSAARRVSLKKPIAVIKAGRTAAAAKAAASHTGSLTGSDDVLDVAFKRAGVLRVNKISEFFSMIEALNKQPLPQGPRLTIVTNAGGPGVLSTDALVSGQGELAELSPEILNKLNETMPPQWSHNNPIDVLGDASPDRYASALEIAAGDEKTDGLLVILTPQDMTDATGTAKALAPYAHSLGKTVYASWMGGEIVQKGRDLLVDAEIPEFKNPDEACDTFNTLWKYYANLKEQYAFPEKGDDLRELAESHKKAAEILNVARSEGRTLLNEYESKKLLQAYGIKTVKTEVAVTREEAMQKATEMGFPVVVKLHSNTITHKTDVGGVKLNLKDAEAVGNAFDEIKNSIETNYKASDFLGVTVQEMVKMDGYELIIGSSIDRQFGPVILFGTGGSLVEVYKDRALTLPPLTVNQARSMMKQTKIYKALGGVRGRKSVDMDALELLMVLFSKLVSNEKYIAELDINPLLISENQMVALDARVVLHDPSKKEEDIPAPAFRPYPMEYIFDEKLPDGKEVTIRPVRAEDVQKLIAFHKGLDEATVTKAYGENRSFECRTNEKCLIRQCFSDYTTNITLAAFAGGDCCKCGSDIIGICTINRSGDKACKRVVTPCDATASLLEAAAKKIAEKEGFCC